MPSLHPHLVRRSALVIKAMCHGPSGAISAAATTSLPEHLGGVRNWDYRYCWPRDACLAAAALIRLGNTGHAMKLLDWLMAVVDECESPDRLRPLYTVTGRVLGPEAEISELSGYADSKPVRIGNAASNQVQLDVFGPIVDVVAMLVERGAPIPPDHWRLVQAMVNAVEARWREPDHGIWEIRGPLQHHVHSKVMCWMTVDRALSIGQQYLGRCPDSWHTLRNDIREEILARGYRKEVNAFTATYDDQEPDAAALWVGLSGLVPPADPRFIGTVEFVERTLRRGPTVYRYRHNDRLPGIEGGFNICTTWLIESLALIGRSDAAHQLFDEYTSLAGPTGLLSEECDPYSGRALGNHPQVYSHLGLINAAVRLASLPKDSPQPS
jgi:trehalose 6-phosphate phosphatase